MIYGLTVESILQGTLIFIRVSAILFALPIFGDQPVPVRVRVLLAVAIAFIVHGLIPAGSYREFPQEIFVFAIFVFKEIAIGFFLGFVSRLAFDAVIMAASLVGFQMGFGVADLLMPDADVHMNAFTALHRIIMILIFLSLNFHHMYFDAIVKSFELIPAASIKPHFELGSFFIKATADIFVISLQLAAPVLVALLFSNTALGLIARTVPQFNVFVMSFPVGFFLGLGVYLSCLPFFPAWAEHHFQASQLQIFQTLKGLVP